MNPRNKHHKLRSLSGLSVAFSLAIVSLNNVQAASLQGELHFKLPGGASMVLSKTPNPQDSVDHRLWNRAEFVLPTGKSFVLLPQNSESDEDTGTQLQTPRETDISPSGKYIVLNRVESGSYSQGPNEQETSVASQYCSAIEIRSGCVLSDQTGEVCGAQWKEGQPNQWGTPDQTTLMLADDRPSVSRLLQFYKQGQAVGPSLNDDGGAANLLRCDPPTASNHDAYLALSKALHQHNVRLEAPAIDRALSLPSDATHAASPAASEQVSAGTAATIKATKAILYSQPDDAHATHGYLIEHDAVLVIRKGPDGWTYIDYTSPAGKHLLRWIKTDSLSMS